MVRFALLVTSSAIAATTALEWKCIFGTSTPVAVTPTGDIACMSSDGRNCEWTGSDAGCQSKLKTPVAPSNPLVCGAAHLAQWGSTGYDNPSHWCSQSKLALQAGQWECPDGILTP
ncbi:hypothetical protein ACHHYP_06719, partial [Achlya hypogyna]